MINGDFNFMNSWSTAERSEFIENIEIKETNGSTISSDKRQAKQLCLLIQDLIMEQYVDTCTRGKNLLDLLFSNNCNLISNVTPMDNVLISDHTLCVMDTNIETENISTKYSKKYLYSTEIMRYALLDASEDDWSDLNNYFNEIDRDNIICDVNDIDKVCDTMINILESGVKQTMKLKEYKKPTTKKDGSNFKSSNIIPRNMPTLFKRKKKLSKAYRTVKSVNRYVYLGRKILEIDIKLKNHYESNLLSDEMKLFEKAKANKNVLYNYIKRKQKSSIKIGPFVKNNKVLNEKPEEILKLQYESIFLSQRRISHKES